MTRKRRPDTGTADPLAAYRRLRKPVPPPPRVERDRRRDALERARDREAQEDRGG